MKTNWMSKINGKEHELLNEMLVDCWVEYQDGESRDRICILSKYIATICGGTEGSVIRVIEKYFEEEKSPRTFSDGKMFYLKKILLSGQHLKYIEAE